MDTTRGYEFGKSTDIKSLLVHKLLFFAENLTSETYQRFLQNTDMTADQLLHSTTILLEGLHLSKRVYDALISEGVCTINDLVEMSDDDVITIDDIGSKSLNQIIGRLGEVGLRLKTKEEVLEEIREVRQLKIEELYLPIRADDFFMKKEVTYISDLRTVWWSDLASSLGKNLLTTLLKDLKNMGAPYCYYRQVQKALFYECGRHHHLIKTLLQYTNRRPTQAECNELLLRRDASAEDVLKRFTVKLDALDFTLRADRILNKNGITSINMLLDLTEADVCALDRMGKSCTENIVRHLWEYDLELMSRYKQKVMVELTEDIELIQLDLNKDVWLFFDMKGIRLVKDLALQMPHDLTAYLPEESIKDILYRLKGMGAPYCLYKNIYKALNDSNMGVDEDIMSNIKLSSEYKASTNVEWVGEIVKIKPRNIAQYLKTVPLAVVLYEMNKLQLPFRCYRHLHRAIIYDKKLQQ